MSKFYFRLRTPISPLSTPLMVARPSSSTSSTTGVRQQSKPNARRKKTTMTATSTTQQNSSKATTTTILNAKTNFHHPGVVGESDTENDGDDENSTIGLNT